MKSLHFPPSNHSKKPREGPGVVTGVLIIPHSALGSVGVVVPNYVDVVSTSASSGTGCRMEIRGNSAGFEDLIRVVEAATDGKFSFLPTGDYMGTIRGQLAEEVEMGRDSGSASLVAKEHSRTMLVEDAIFWAGDGLFGGVVEEEEQKGDEHVPTEQDANMLEANEDDEETQEQRRERRVKLMLKKKDQDKASESTDVESLEVQLKQVSESSLTEEELRNKSKEKHNQLTVFRKVLTRHKTYQAKVLARKELWVLISLKAGDVYFDWEGICLTSPPID